MSVRREKYRAVERKKCWDHHLTRQREKTEDMDGVVEEESAHQLENDVSPEDDNDATSDSVGRSRLGEDAGVGKDVEQKAAAAGVEGEMETSADQPKFSNKYLAKLSKAWSGRRDRRKKQKRLTSKKKQKW